MCECLSFTGTVKEEKEATSSQCKVPEAGLVTQVDSVPEVGSVTEGSSATQEDADGGILSFVQMLTTLGMSFSVSW